MKPIYRICLMYLLLSSFTASAAFSQTLDARILILNQPQILEIKGGEIHEFSLRIGADQTARIEIEQQGIDVSLAAKKPSGEIFIETESPSGILGSDLILVTATEAGEYKVAVISANPKALAGKYTIKLAELRPTVPNDLEINQASGEITKVAQETHVLRSKGTIEGRRQALEKFQEVIRLSKIKQDKVWEIIAVLSSGFIYDQLGEYQKSLDFYLQGLSLSREVGNREYEGSAINNLGNSYKNLGDFEQAIFYLDQALNIAREVGDRQGEAISLNNLGTCYILLGAYPKAVEVLTKSLPIRRELKERKGEGNTLNNIGLAYLNSGDRAKAIDYFQQALAIRREIGDKQGEAVTLGNVGKSFLETGDLTKAFENYAQSNEIAGQLGDRRVEANSFYELAKIERSRGNLPKAIENVEKGLRIIEQIRSELINPELRIAYFSSVQQFYELYTDLLVARYEKTKDPNDIALALETSERARTRSLTELLQEARVNIKQGVDMKLLEQAQDLQNALNLKYRQRTAAVGRKATEEQIAKFTDEINALTIELENLQTKIRRENPRYADLTLGTNISAREIQNLLTDDTALLEYKLGETRSFLWLVTKDSIEIYTLPARSEIERTARDFYASVVSHKKTDEAKISDLSKKLSGILLAPIASKIENKRLAIVADGVLQFVPFAALSGSKFLVDTNEVVILPSAGVLAELRENKNERKTPEKTIAIFADPIFEANDTRLSSVSKNKKSDEKPPEISRVLRNFNFGETLPRLLSSRIEAKNISAFAEQNKTDLNMDFDANRENATSANLSDYRILHFATHGLLDTVNPELSGLVLSLYNKKGEAQDGFLSLNQIYNLNLNSDLIVLSACQTALGKDVRGEGLIGLTRGFMYAGAKRVVASLWKVDDAATAEFMRRFYQNLLQKNLPAVAALKQTKMEMKQVPRFRSAYFWAGFTLQGDWK